MRPEFLIQVEQLFHENDQYNGKRLILHDRIHNSNNDTSGIKYK